MLKKTFEEGFNGSGLSIRFIHSIFFHHSTNRTFSIAISPKKLINFILIGKYSYYTIS